MHIIASYSLYAPPPSPTLYDYVKLIAEGPLCPASSGNIKRGYLAEAWGAKHIGLKEE